MDSNITKFFPPVPTTTSSVASKTGSAGKMAGPVGPRTKTYFLVLFLFLDTYFC